MLDQANVVRIRIWTSEFHATHQGEDVGHVSIEIPSITVDHLDKKNPLYISLWPRRPFENDSSKKEYSFFTPEDHKLLNSYQDDLNAEGRKPELTICLYSLDCQEMFKKFNAIKKNLKGWALMGSNTLLNNNQSESCASIAYAVLKAGDVKGIIHSGSSTSSVISPDMLSVGITDAKTKEKIMAPETKDFKDEFETEIKEKVEKCSIV